MSETGPDFAAVDAFLSGLEDQSGIAEVIARANSAGRGPAPTPGDPDWADEERTEEMEALWPAAVEDAVRKRAQQRAAVEPVVRAEIAAEIRAEIASWQAALNSDRYSSRELAEGRLEGLDIAHNIARGEAS